MQTVFVGMSGGVDSSVSAALLIDQGYKVVGIFMKNWTKDFPGTPCTWKDDYQDAKRVATKLGIELKVYDFQGQYRQKVVDYMIREYQSGRTPNPDIMCNQEVKFKLFLDSALSDGADLIATGHYARTKNGHLYTSANSDKDQTYFLYRVSSDALKQTLFPLGDFKSKLQVRDIAKKLNLATADKKDSQGICFVGQVGMKDFLTSELGPQKPGNIIISNNSGNNQIIGEHEGAIYYTIGQRHGLNIGGGLPYYVVGKNISKNEIYVSSDIDSSSLWSSEISLADIHWIYHKPKQGKSYQVRSRHRGQLVSASIKFDPETSSQSNNIKIMLSQKVRAITPGQSTVIYDNDEVIGGGIVV